MSRCPITLTHFRLECMRSATLNSRSTAKVMYELSSADISCKAYHFAECRFILVTNSSRVDVPLLTPLRYFTSRLLSRRPFLPSSSRISSNRIFPFPSSSFLPLCPVREHVGKQDRLIGSGVSEINERWIHLDEDKLDEIAGDKDSGVQTRGGDEKRVEGIGSGDNRNGET